MNPEFNLIHVVRTLLKWKWHIVSVTFLAAIAAVIVSLYVMKPYYQSFALLYPTNQSMGDRAVLFGNKSGDSEAYYYGTKHDANRILTLATSSVLVQYIINEYNLAEHYKFKGKKYEATYTTEKFMKLYKVYKTDKDAIRINLLDTDPELAATIVNDVVATIEYETSKPIQANKEQLARLFAEKASEKKSELEDLKEELLSLKSKSDNFEIKQKEYDFELAEYHNLADLASQYALAAKQQVPGVEVIEYAYPAERKLKPVRSIIVLSTVFITFILACLGAILVEEALYIKEQL
jgi:tyrosine-protein kinase Etk/Wzc